MRMKYAICDIETTGGNNRTGKIIEIAIFLVEDNVIIDEFQSLINPERPIPPFITSMTGISEEMVANAPKFFEITKRIVEITNEAVFVAHNVSFDYNYIATEFARLGYTFQREKMCTLALSRKILPGHEKYSLGN
ncbi:MAG: exonuclease, partial [Bacteroidetes bacterium HGW-Bacteroidetes-6]